MLHDCVIHYIFSVACHLIELEKKLVLLVLHNIDYIVTFFAGSSHADVATETTTETVDADIVSSTEGSGTGKTYIHLL
jgi:hypothetical protein